MKISIIGAGNVGGLTAMQLCSLGFSEIVLIDTMQNLACAKALDLNDARFIFKHNYRIQGTNDINQIANSEILIITAGVSRKPGMKREELIEKNSRIIIGICSHIKRLKLKPVIIVVTNPLDAMTHLVLKETQLPANLVLGMGLTLDIARLANLIAENLNVSVTEIEPFIIGSHGEKMLPLSRYTKVKGLSLNTYLMPQEISALFQKTLARGALIVSKLGNGSAYFAPSSAICELTKAIAMDEKRILPVSVYLNGEYDLTDLCIGLPCCLGKNGIERIIELELDTQESKAFLKSAASIKEQITAINGQSYAKVVS